MEDQLESTPYGSDHPYRPTPNPATGELLIDPEILLKAKRFNLQIDFFYSTFQNVASEFGYNRSASTKAYVLSSVSTDIVSIVRGDFAVYPFRVESPGAETTYISYLQSGCTTTLIFDGTTFTETTNDGTQMAYQAQLGTTGDPVTYQLTTVTDSVGNAHTYSYSGGLLETIVVPGGNVVNFNYSGGLVDYIEDWSGRRWSFTYDGDQNLIEYQVPLGCITGYSYGGGIDGLLVSAITDPQGYSTQYTYDDEGRVVSMLAGTALTNWNYGTPSNGWTVQQSPFGALTTYGYDQWGNATTIVRPEGYTVTHIYNEQRMKTGTVTPRGTLFNVNYDSTSYLLLNSTDPLNNETIYQYDSYGNNTTRIDALGNVTTGIYTGSTRLKLVEVDPLGRRTTFSYNPDGTVRTQQDPRGLLTLYNYDAFGNVASVLYSDGGVVSNVYDVLNRLVATTDQIGRTTHFSYDAADNVVSTMNALSQISTFVYSSCLLIAKQDPLGNRTTYTYDRFNNLVTTTDPLSHVTNYYFDAMGRPTGSKLPTGDTTTLNLNPAGQLMSMTDGMGFATKFSYDGSGCRNSMTNANNNTTEYVCNARDLIQIIDPLSGVTARTYDALGRLVTITDPLSHSVQTFFDAAGQRQATSDQMGRLTQFQYDANGNLVTTTDALGKNWVQVYEPNSNRLSASIDPLGNGTSYLYDLASQRIAVRDPLGHRISYGYDLAGRLVTTTDPLGYIVTQSYDAAGRPVSIMNARGYVTATSYDMAGRAVSIMDAAGNVTTTNYDASDRVISLEDAFGFFTTTVYNQRGLASYTYDQLNNYYIYLYDADGNRMTSKDPNGYYVYTGFDALGRVCSRIDENGNQSLFSYDAASRQTVVKDAIGGLVTTSYDPTGRVVSVIDQVGHLSTNTYDFVGRLTGVIDPLGHLSQTGFDAAGRMVTHTTPMGFVTTYGYDAASRNVSIVNPRGAVASLAYDARNSLVSHIDAVGNVTSYLYDGNRNRYQVQDPLNNLTTTTFDSLDRPIAVKDANNLVTSYQYDASSRLIGVRNPRGYWTTMAYTPRNQLASMIDPNGLITTYSYDNVGNPIVRQFPTGDVTDYGFDGIGNVKQILYHDGSRATHMYDTLNRRTTLMDSGGVTSYSYGPTDLMLGKIDPGGLVQNYLYDPADQRTQLTDPEAQVRYTAYDADGRVASLLTQDGRIITFQYDSNGNRTTELFHSGWKRTISYDLDDRIVGISEIGVAADLEERWTFTYDAFGNRNTIADLMGNFTTLTFDHTYRLLQSSTTGPLAHVYNYAYDAAGNRTFSDESGTPTSYSYDPGNRLTTSLAGTAMSIFTYDRNSNLTGVLSGFGPVTMTYNYENRLASHQAPGSRVTLTYEANGAGYLRAQQVDGAITTNIWDGDSQLGQYGIPTVYLTGGISYVRMETPSPAPNGTTTAFSMSQTPAVGSETVFLNGVAQDPGTDYTVSGATFTMTSAPSSMDQLSVSYFTGSETGYHRMEVPSPATNGSTTVFTIAHSPVSGTPLAYLNGIAQDPGRDYTISGVTLTYTAAPASTDKLRVDYVDSAVGLPTGVSQSGLLTPVPAVDGVTRIFSFTGQSGMETVYLNGVALRPGPGNDYEISGTVITLAKPPASTDLLLVDAYSGWGVSLGALTKYYQDLVEGRILGRVTGGASVSEYGTDALGSVTSNRNGTSGALLSTYRFKPYGETLATSGAGLTGPYLFVGGAGYNAFARPFASFNIPWRIYDSSTGRFTTADPIGLEGGMNLFEYAEGNPSNIFDPQGLTPQNTRPNDLKRIFKLLGFKNVNGRYVATPSNLSKSKSFSTSLKLSSPRHISFLEQATGRNAPKLGDPISLFFQYTGSKPQVPPKKVSRAARLAFVRYQDIMDSWKSEGGRIDFDPEGYAALIGGQTQIDRIPLMTNPSGNAVTYGGVVHLADEATWQNFIGRTAPSDWYPKSSWREHARRWRKHEHTHLFQVKYYFHGDTSLFLKEIVSEYIQLLDHDHAPLEIDANNRAGLYDEFRWYDDKVDVKGHHHKEYGYTIRQSPWHNPVEYLGPSGPYPDWIFRPPYNLRHK